MHIAADLGIFPLVELLAKYNPNLSLENSVGETPEQRASNCGHGDVADYLYQLEIEQRVSARRMR